MLTTLKSAVRSHAPQYNKASMLQRPLGEGVQNVSKGLRLRQQRPVFSCCCCSAPDLVEGSTGAADGEEFQVSKGFLSTQLDTNTTQKCVCVCVVCVYYSISNRSVHKAPSICVLLISRSPVESRMFCYHHHLIQPEPV